MFISGTKEIDREARQYDYGKHFLKVRTFIYGS